MEKNADSAGPLDIPVMPIVGYQYDDGRDYKLLRPILYSTPQNAPEGFEEVPLVKLRDAEAAIDALRTANKLAARMEADAHERATDAYNRAIDDCIKELGVWIYTDGQCLEAIKALKTHNAELRGRPLADGPA